MLEALQQFKALDTEQEQALAFAHRARSRSFRDPTKEIFRTHRLGIEEASVDTGAFFPDRARPITFATAIEITGATPSGFIFEFGSSTTGFSLGIASPTQIGFNVGDVVGSGGDGALATVPGLNAPGNVIHLVAAIHPGLGKAQLFVDGDILIRLNSDPMPNAWSSAAAGSIGSAPNGTANERSGPLGAAPTDFQLVKILDAYQGNIPRHFEK